jgi:hypothetical protein
VVLPSKGRKKDDEDADNEDNEEDEKGDESNEDEDEENIPPYPPTFRSKQYGRYLGPGSAWKLILEYCPDEGVSNLLSCLILVSRFISCISVVLLSYPLSLYFSRNNRLSPGTAH